MGTLIGTAAFGCGDGGGGTDGTSGGGTSGDGTSGDGSSSTGGGSETSSSGVPTTSGGTDDGTTGTSTGAVEDTSTGGTSTGDASTGDASTGDETTGGPHDECGGGAQLTPKQLLAGIDHVVVLMMENRSFDHYFGARKLVEGAAVDGLVGDEQNLDMNLMPVQVFAMEEFEPKDPPHGWESCHNQFNLGENNGFVFENEKSNPGFGEQAMGYHIREHIPVLYGLADKFTLCQRWFCSVMGPTWPNRYYMHSCTSGGGKTNFPSPFLKTLWHRCDEAGITSRNYWSDVPWVAGAYPLIPTVWSKLAEDYGGFNLNTLTNPNNMARFFKDCQAGDLPNFTVIDPGYTSNDDHPEHNIQLGQILIGAIYKALAGSPVWNKTLFIITYDEHGGFYDHVAPPETDDAEPEFKQMGFRVPALVIGPSVRRGCVSDLQFDHCSIGKTLMTRFGIAPLNDRMAKANDFSSCIHPDYIDDPQPGPPVPLIDASISELLAGVGHTTSQPELFVAAGVTLDEAFQRKVRADTMHLLEQAQKLGVVRLRP